jgi:hypothetical protein
MPAGSSKSIYDILNEVYTAQGYYARYSLDVWVTVILCCIFVVIIFYNDLKNRIQPIKKDWIRQRCNPAVIPFAGLINNGPDTTPLEFTAQNFSHCTQNILKQVASVAFQPFYYMLHVITDLFDEIKAAINNIRAVFNKIRVALQRVTNSLMEQLASITIPIIQLTIIVKDTLQKVVGSLTGVIYTLYGSYLAMKSFFLFMVDLIITILIIIAGIIAGLIVISMIPIFGSWAFIPIASMTAIMILILIPTIMIKIFIDDVLSASTRSTPGVPGCFAATTPILVKKKKVGLEEKHICDVEVGDILAADEAVVTGIIKFAAVDQHVYNLYGVLVTGEHRVKHDTLGWLQVKNHPASVLVPAFSEPFVYCLLTSTKTFQLGNIVYSDWDDIDERVNDALQRNCVAKGYLPANFTDQDIHIYLDNGFHGDSLVHMEDGSLRLLSEVKVYDKVADGGRVLGVIKIKASDMDIFMYSLRSSSDQYVLFCGTGNIQISDPDFSGEQNGLQINYKSKIAHKEEYMYQLLTDTGRFTLNGISFKDYNSGLDKYLF